nr:uncharacterized protein LOC112918632 [Vulpes vulpes]
MLPPGTRSARSRGHAHTGKQEADPARLGQRGRGTPACVRVPAYAATAGRGGARRVTGDRRPARARGSRRHRQHRGLTDGSRARRSPDPAAGSAAPLRAPAGARAALPFQGLSRARSRFLAGLCLSPRLPAAGALFPGHPSPLALPVPGRRLVSKQPGRPGFPSVGSPEADPEMGSGVPDPSSVVPGRASSRPSVSRRRNRPVAAQWLVRRPQGSCRARKFLKTRWESAVVTQRRHLMREFTRPEETVRAAEPCRTHCFILLKSSLLYYRCNLWISLRSSLRAKAQGSISLSHPSVWHMRCSLR